MAGEWTVAKAVAADHAVAELATSGYQVQMTAHGRDKILETKRGGEDRQEMLGDGDGFVIRRETVWTDTPGCVLQPEESTLWYPTRR